VNAATAGHGIDSTVRWKLQRVSEKAGHAFEFADTACQAKVLTPSK
jgi:hypothetical protein